MTNRAFRAALALLLFVLAALSPLAPAVHAAPLAPAAPPGEKPASRFIRVIDDDRGARVKLQVAARSYERDGAPTLWLASAVHIGERSFYRALQESLDSKDLVLFEGVKPPGAGDAAHEGEALSDDRLARATTRRIRFLAVAVELAQRNTGGYPATLTDAAEAGEPRLSRLVRASLDDAWGRPFTYAVTDTGFEITSLGADGSPGGDGPAADLAWSAMPPLRPDELPARNPASGNPGARRPGAAGDDGVAGDDGGGIQSQLARALGLVFQLDVMDHDLPHWRNSDLAVDQVQDRLIGGGADADQLFSMLGGEGFAAGLARSVLGMIGASPMLRTMTKVIMVDMLAQAEDILKQAPAGMGKLMDVLIHDRNDVVEADLKAALADGVPRQSIAIIYGAGHMPDLERRILALGFTPDREVWFTAIDADTRLSGLPPAQVRSLRAMVRDTMRQALAQNTRRSPPARAVTPTPTTPR